MTVFALICAAIVIEGLITYIKTIVVDKVFQWQVLAAFIIGVVVAVAYNLDIFALFGLVSVIPYIGCVLTGILISRGSNYVFDLITLVNGFKTSAN